MKVECWDCGIYRADFDVRCARHRDEVEEDSLQRRVMQAAKQLEQAAARLGQPR